MPIVNGVQARWVKPGIHVREDEWQGYRCVLNLVVNTHNQTTGRQLLRRMAGESRKSRRVFMVIEAKASSTPVAPPLEKNPKPRTKTPSCKKVPHSSHASNVKPRYPMDVIVESLGKLYLDL